MSNINWFEDAGLTTANWIVITVIVIGAGILLLLAVFRTINRSGKREEKEVHDHNAHPEQGAHGHKKKRLVPILIGALIAVIIGASITDVVTSASMRDRAAQLACIEGTPQSIRHFKPGQYRDIYVSNNWKADYTPGPETGKVSMCSPSDPKRCWSPGHPFPDSNVRITNISHETFLLGWTITCPAPRPQATEDDS